MSRAPVNQALTAGAGFGTRRKRHARGAVRTSPAPHPAAAARDGDIPAGTHSLSGLSPPGHPTDFTSSTQSSMKIIRIHHAQLQNELTAKLGWSADFYPHSTSPNDAPCPQMPRLESKPRFTWELAACGSPPRLSLRHGVTETPQSTPLPTPRWCRITKWCWGPEPGGLISSRPCTARCLLSPDLRAACEGQTLGRWAEQCGNISRVTKTNKPNPAGSPFHLSSFVRFCFSVKVALSSPAVVFQPRRVADPKRYTASFPMACLHSSIHF